MNLDHSYARLPDVCYSDIVPQPAESPKLLAWNHELAEELGVGHLGSEPADCARTFSGGPLPGEFRPIALAYAGHQFGAFVPQLGDGRAALLGEVVDRHGNRWDIQLKGSGRTPYSRGGDGRSWLGPVLREYLVSEAMHRLGVPTTRALAAVATGETVYREAPLPGAVFTRIAASHLRIGTFEYLAARGLVDELVTLADYAIERHYPDAADGNDPYLEFFRLVSERQAELVAGWMAVGFVHGVMNTDNASIAGETIDYGPCAFLDEFRMDKVFSSIDHGGRYAFANQAAIAQWNLARLAECLLRIRDARDAFVAVLDQFPSLFESAWQAKMAAKLGMTESEPGDDALIGEWLNYLEENELDYTMSFRNLGLRVDDDDDPVFGEFEMRWRRRVLGRDRTAQEVAEAMNSVNPKFIPRNHLVERAIQQAVDGDTSNFLEFDKVLKRPFDEQPDYTNYAEPPKPDERVTATFCGT